MGHLKNYQKKREEEEYWSWEPFAEECKTKMREGGDTHLCFFVFLTKSVRAPDHAITRLQFIQATEILVEWRVVWSIAGAKK